MDVEFEILAILATAFLFTVGGLVIENFKVTITLKLLAAIAWFSLALGFVAATPSFLGFSLLFMGVGMVFVILGLMDVLDWFAEDKKTEQTWWKE